MLNLSDKELDRLSKEAAQEYEPGVVLGPDAWERLKIRLDSDLGGVGPNPLRHIRRFPFYYAPLLLVLLGISYYYLTKHPPTAHLLVKNSSTTQNPTLSSNSTPSDKSSSNPTDAAGAPRPTEAPRPTSATHESASAPDATKGAPIAAGNGKTASSKEDAASPTGKSLAGSGRNSASTHANSVAPSPAGGNLPASGRNRGATTTSAAGSIFATGAARSNTGKSANHGGSSAHPGNGRQTGEATGKRANTKETPENNTLRNPAAPTNTPEHELVRSTIQGLRPTKKPAVIDDSALRAFTLKSTPPGPIRRHALYIKRNWQFGAVAAPDFASVNSLAGDKPGSTVGLTVDYQFAPRWYLGSGLLIDRRNYAARSQDFHPPHSFYTNINVSQNNVDFVKGSFEMLEIPLNLRYDFSVTGSTLFFASAGVSSYVLTTDNGNCYINWYGREVPKGFHYPGQGNYLFSAMNLSLGVETGLSNSMSLLIAPYMKVPLGTIGFGQVQMSSVGISFSLKWAPVTSRKRR